MIDQFLTEIIWSSASALDCYWLPSINMCPNTIKCSTKGSEISLERKPIKTKWSFVVYEIMNTSAIISSPVQWTSSLLSQLTLFFFGCLLLLCLVIVGLVANITVCVVMFRGGRFKKHLSNFMLFHLSITDIAYRLIVVPGQWASIFYPFETKPTMLCKVAKTFLYTFNTAVFTSLVVTAFDRHQSITRPFQRLKHKPKLYRYLLAVWGYSIMCALPQMLNSGNGTHAVNFTLPAKGANSTYAVHFCVSSNTGSSQRIVALIYFVLGFLVPLLLITVAYSKISVFLWRKSRNRMINQAALKSKGKALRMLVLMVLGFVICLGVPQLYELMKSFGFKGQAAIGVLSVILYLSSSVINPVIYGLYSAEFKQGLKQGR